MKLAQFEVGSELTHRDANGRFQWTGFLPGTAAPSA